MPDELRDPQIGISIRFIRQWNPEWAKHPTSADVELVRRAMITRIEVCELARLFALPSPPLIREGKDA